MKNSFNETVKGIAIAGGIFLLGLLIGRTVTSPIIVAGEAASWAQFLGGILAVIAAYVFGERQSRAAMQNALNLQTLELQRKRDALLAILQAARTATQRLEERYTLTPQGKNKFRGCYDAAAYAGFLEAVSAISVLDLGSVEAVLAITGLKKAMSEIQTRAAVFIDTKIPAATVLYPDNRRDESQDLWIQVQVVMARMHHNKLIAALGGS